MRSIFVETALHLMACVLPIVVKKFLPQSMCSKVPFFKDDFNPVLDLVKQLQDASHICDYDEKTPGNGFR